MDQSPRPLHLSYTSAVAEIVFNRPASLNALDVDMAIALRDALLEIQQRDDLRAVVLKGSGRAFMAGGDLASLRENAPHNAQALIVPLHQAVTLLTSLPLPVVAQLHGVVAGAGISIALACDFVLAAQDTRFNFAYSSIGASPDASGSWHLPRLVGLHKGMQLLMLDGTLDARQALELGLVGQLHPAEELATKTEALLQRLRTAPTFALGQTKKLLRQALHTDLATQLEAERKAFCACAASSDFATGVEAFFQRQPPHFTGR